MDYGLLLLVLLCGKSDPRSFFYKRGYSNTPEDEKAHDFCRHMNICLCLLSKDSLLNVRGLQARLVQSNQLCFV